MTRRSGFVVVALVLGACSSAPAVPSAESSATTTTAPGVTTTVSPVTSTTPSEGLVDLTDGATVVGTGPGLAEFPPEYAIDDDDSTWWSAADLPVQRLRIDFAGVADVFEVTLVTSQDPPGPTVHRILSPAGAVLHVFSGDTADKTVLTYRPESLWPSLSGLVIETTSSPSWVAWREVEVLGAMTGEGGFADIVFTGGVVETMAPGLPTSTALAVRDGGIVALGDEATALIGPATHVIDLDGRALLPGLVDPHTHVLTDDPIGFEEAQQRHLSLGYTTVGDTGIGPDELAAFIDRADKGQLRLRLVGYLNRTDNCGVDQGTWYEAYPAGTAVGDRFRIAGVKIFNDGGTCGPVAASEPYLEGAALGPTFFSVDELTQMFRAADSAGYQILVHAQGDLAVGGALDAYERLLGGRPNELRHRIEHNAIVAPEDLGRHGALGIVATVFGAWPTCTDVPVTPFFEANGENWRRFVDGNPGAHISWHGDDPWVPPLSPLGDMYSYLTRREIAPDGSICQPPAWLEDGTLDMDTVLRIMFPEAAYALGMEDSIGTLEVGKRADLVVLSASPRLVPVDEIPLLSVAGTWVDGLLEYCGDPAVCG